MRLSLFAVCIAVLVVWEVEGQRVMCAATTMIDGDNSTSSCPFDPTHWRDLQRHRYTTWLCRDVHDLRELQNELRSRLCWYRRMDALVFSYPSFLKRAAEVSPSTRRLIDTDWLRVDELFTFKRSLMTIDVLYTSSFSGAVTVEDALRRTFEETVVQEDSVRAEVQKQASPLYALWENLQQKYNNTLSPLVQYPLLGPPLTPELVVPTVFVGPVVLRVGYNTRCRTCRLIVDAAERVAQVVEALCRGGLSSVVACAPAFYVVTYPMTDGWTSPYVHLSTPERFLFGHNDQSFTLSPSAVESIAVAHGSVLDWVEEIVDCLLRKHVVQLQFLNQTEAEKQHARRDAKIRDRTVNVALQRQVRSVNKTLWSKLTKLAAPTRPVAEWRFYGVEFLNEKNVLSELTSEELKMVARMREVSDEFTLRMTTRDAVLDYFNSLGAVEQQAITRSVQQTTISMTNLVERLAMSANVSAAMSLNNQPRRLPDPELLPPTLYRLLSSMAQKSAVACCLMMLIYRCGRDAVHFLRKK